MKKILSNWKYQKILFLAVGVLLLFIVAYRAAILSFTFDESGTYLFYKDNTVWELFFEEKVWSSANNHILNTLLYKLSILVFGTSDFTLRLPNVIAFAAMYLVNVFYLFPHFRSFWPRLTIILILFINPYTLEFYSLCRGYGLSMFFHFTALCCFWNYVKFKNNASLYWAFFWLSLAALSLLTNLLLLPVYALALWIVCYGDKENRKHIVAAPMVFSILSLGLLIRPIYFLSKNNEFNFGVSNLWHSFETLVGKSLGFQAYTQQIPTALFTVIFVMLIVLMLYKAYKNKKMAFFGLSLFLLMLSLLVCNLILGMQFPGGRKATIFIPLIALLMSGLINESNLTKLKRGILLTSTILLSIHFIKVTQLDATIEWAFDKNTKKQATILKEKSQGKPYIVQANWLQQSTLNYYIETMNMKNLILLPVTKEFKVNGDPDAIICTKEQITPFPNYTSPYPEDDRSIFLKEKGKLH